VSASEAADHSRADSRHKRGEADWRGKSFAVANVTRLCLDFEHAMSRSYPAVYIGFIFLYEITISRPPRSLSNLYAERTYLFALNSGASFMLDVTLVALGIGFFVVAILYTSACNRL
jgi:hypothetical protein